MSQPFDKSSRYVGTFFGFKVYEDPTLKEGEFRVVSEAHITNAMLEAEKFVGLPTPLSHVAPQDTSGERTGLDTPEVRNAPAGAAPSSNRTPALLLHVQVAEMGESNGRVTWIVYLKLTEDAAPWDSYQVYDSTIKGRAEYEAARLRHFLGQAPEPDMTDFDVDAPDSAIESSILKDAERYRRIRAWAWISSDGYVELGNLDAGKDTTVSDEVVDRAVDKAIRTLSRVDGGSASG